MKIEWTVTFSHEISESDMEEMVAGVAEEGWTEDMVHEHITDAISCWDDEFFYSFNDEAYDQVWQEVMRRVALRNGGQQLRMEGV